MKILVVGAGGVGGYFGGRLLEKGEDVTFLVRPKRYEQLERHGLHIESIHGSFSCTPKLITKDSQSETFDLILFSTKAYHLNEAIEDIKPFVGKNTTILPLLNGIRHLEDLRQTFGEEKIIGGLCFIETTLNHEGVIVQTSKDHHLKFGELSGEKTARIEKISKALSGTKAEIKESTHILRDMWHKYLFITTFSGVTSLFQSPIGPIRETAFGLELVEDLLFECEAIMKKEGAPIDEQIVSKHLATLNKIEPTMKSSMQRDMEKQSFIEADHLQGFLLKLSEKHDLHAPILKIIYTNLKLYEKK